MKQLTQWLPLLLIGCALESTPVQGQVYEVGYPGGTCYFYTALNDTIVPQINFPITIDWSKPEATSDKIDSATKYQVPNPMLNFIEGKDKWVFQVICGNGGSMVYNMLNKECFATRFADGSVMTKNGGSCIWMTNSDQDHKIEWIKEDPNCVMQPFQIRFCSKLAIETVNGKDVPCQESTGHCFYTSLITVREECFYEYPFINNNTRTVDDVQFKPITNEVYQLPEIIQANGTGCPLDKTISYITDESDNNITSVIFDDTTTPWKVIPSPQNQLDQQYKFKIHVYNTWMDTLLSNETSIVYTLNVGCPRAAFSEIAGLMGTPPGAYQFTPGTSLVLKVQDAGTNIFTFTAGTFLPPGTFTCAFSKNTQINVLSKDSTYGSVTANVFQEPNAADPEQCPDDGLTPCIFLSVDSTDMQFEIIFTVRFYVIGYQDTNVVDGVNPHVEIGPINLTVTCQDHPGQQLKSPEPNPTITEFILSFENPGNHSLFFNETTCTITSCCTLNYVIRNVDTGQIVPNDFYDEEAPLCLNCENGKNYFNINVFKEREPMRVRIEAQNREGYVATSIEFVVAVIKFTQPCLTDTIQVNQTMPDSGETPEFRDYFKTEKGPMLHIQRHTYQIPSYKINVVRRAELGLPNECPIFQYSISQVLDAANTNQTVEMFTYVDVVFMDPNYGDFIVKSFKQDLDWYVLLDYDNGYRKGTLDFIRLTILPMNNEPPKFKSALELWEIVTDDIENSAHWLQLPEVMDPEGDEWTIEIQEDMPAFFKFHAQNQTIDFDVRLIDEKDLGIYLIQIKLVDIYENERNYLLTVEIREKFQFQQQFSQSGENSGFLVELAQEQVKSVSAKMEFIDSMGMVQIKFNYTMQTPQNDPELPLNHTLGWINSSLFDIYVQYEDGYFDLEEEEIALIEEKYPGQYNLTWWPVSYQDQELKIQIIFKYPLRISKNAIRDRLVINLLNGTENAQKFHRLGQTQTFWHNETWTMDRPIRKQNVIPVDSETTSSAQKVTNVLGAATGGLLIVMIFSILIYLLTQSERTIRQFFIMVRALQLLMHVPIFNVVLPANVMSSIEIFFPLLGFDLLEVVLDWEQSPLKFDIEGYEEYADEHIFGQIVDMGYESPNTIFILNTLAILLVVYFVQFLVLVVAWVFVKATENEYGGQKFVNKLQYQLFFNELHGIFIGAFFEFGISATLTYQYGVYKYSGDKVSLAIAYFSFFICIIFLPINLIWILTQSEETLNDEVMEAKQGQLYSDVKIKSLWSRSYYLIFIIRRTIYIVLGLFVMHPVSAQLLCLQFMNIFTVIYQGQVMPSRSHFENKVDLINEFLIEITCMSIILFTPWINDPELEYEIGWFTLSIIFLCSFMNICLVLFYFGQVLKMLNQKLLKMVNRYLDKREIQKKNKFYEDNKEEIEAEMERRRRELERQEFEREMDEKGVAKELRERVWSARQRAKSGDTDHIFRRIPSAYYEDEFTSRKRREQEQQKKAVEDNLRREAERRQQEEEEAREIKRKADLWRSRHNIPVISQEDVIRKSVIPAQQRSEQTNISIQPPPKKETEASKHLKLLKSKQNVKISSEMPSKNNQFQQMGSYVDSMGVKPQQQKNSIDKYQISSKDKKKMNKSLKMLKHKMSDQWSMKKMGDQDTQLRSRQKIQQQAAMTSIIEMNTEEDRDSN